jgi:uncharacterized protein (DUF608 family)
VLDARVLNSDLPPSYTGALHGPKGNQFGTGPQRETMAGMPHFEDAAFTGDFPLARLQFKDRDFPAQVALTAFNPFIPLNSRDSSIPDAFFEIDVTNNLDSPCDYIIVFALSNPAPVKNSVHRYVQDDTFHIMQAARNDCPPHHVEYGNMTIATDAGHVSFQEYWFRGKWFDNLSVYWNDMLRPGDFLNRT